MRLSGKFILRIPPELHQKLKTQAMSAHKSLNEYCQDILASSVETQSASSAPSWIDPVVHELPDSWKKHLSGVVLFGSAARNETDAQSDIDLLFVFDPTFRITREHYRTWDQEIAPRLPASSHEISPHLVHPPSSIEEAGSLWLETAIDGIVLSESNHGVSEILIAIRSLIASGQIQRAFSHGHSYWIRKGHSRKDVA